MKRNQVFSMCYQVFLLAIFFVVPVATGFAQGLWIKDSSEGLCPIAGSTALNLNNHIYIIGGNDQYIGFDSIHVFDPATHLWMSTFSSLVQGAYEGAGTAAEIQGKIYAFGGGWLLFHDSSYDLSTTFVFDTSSKSWSPLKTIGRFTSRESLSSCVVNGKIYAIGGDNQDNGFFNYLSTVEIFDPSTNTWSTPVTAGSLVPRSGHTSSAVNGKIYVIGGWNIGASTDPPNQVFDPATNTWSTFSSDGFIDREFHTACVVNGLIYVIGGSTQSGIADLQDTLQIYDPSTDTWITPATIGTMTARTMVSSAVVNNKIYVLGGYYDNSTRNTVEVFTPSSSGVWIADTSTNSFSLNSYPDPTSFRTTLSFALPEAGAVILTITDAVGRETSMLQSVLLAAGPHEVTWDTSKFPSGVYLLRLSAGGNVATKKLIVEH